MPIEAEKDSEQDIFEQTGGKILESYSDGRPKTWLCGLGENGGKINPPGVQENQAVFNLDKDGKWQGNNPGQKVLEERDQWQTH